MCPLYLVLTCAQVITGAGSGIGKATAEVFAESGAKARVQHVWCNGDDDSVNATGSLCGPKLARRAGVSSMCQLYQSSVLQFFRAQETVTEINEAAGAEAFQQHNALPHHRPRPT